MKHLELFAGIGGFRRAIELVGKDLNFPVECVGYSEIDPKASLTYQACYKPKENELVIGDIVAFTAKKSDIKKLPAFDILTGGFPCQTFSMMGKQAGFGEERGQMFFRIMDILNVKKPKYVLLENVKNLVNHDNGNTFKRIVAELEWLGYSVFYDIFDTANFHLPQRRNRIVIFATRGRTKKKFDKEFNAENVKKLFEQDYKKMSIPHFKDVCGILSKKVDPKYFLSERIKPTLLSNGSAGFKSKSDINQIIARPLTATMHKMHRACQDNYYSQDFIESNGKENPVKTLSKEELAKLQIRKLTPEEAFALQGFPANFADKGRRKGVADGALYKQAGNAVSVNTIYAVLYFLIKNNYMEV